MIYEKNRFWLYDELGYFRSYKSYRRAVQAIKDLKNISRIFPTRTIWKIVDKSDNSVSFIKGD